MPTGSAPTDAGRGQAPATFLGSGKVETLARAIAEADVSIVLFDNELSPAQLRELPNTVLLPHIGSATHAARVAMAKLAAANVIAVIEGLEPPSPLV